jgi:beta-lactamase class A
LKNKVFQHLFILLSINWFAFSRLYTKSSKISAPAKIVLNPKGQISRLLFQSPQAKVASLEDAIAQFKTLPGKVSVLVREGKTTKAALNPQTPLAVGSAFKLAVLKALKSEIALGKRSWKDVVQLHSSMKTVCSYCT